MRLTLLERFLFGHLPFGKRIKLLLLSSWEFFTASLADGFWMESKWQQVKSSHQDSSQYSGRSQQCYRLDGLRLSSYFLVLQPLYQSLGECTKCAYYSWYHRHFHDPYFFQFSSKVYVLIFFPLSFSFTLWSAGRAKSTIQPVLIFLIIFINSHVVWSVWPRLGNSFVSQNPKKDVCVSFFRKDSGLCSYHLSIWSNLNYLDYSQ